MDVKSIARSTQRENRWRFGATLLVGLVMAAVILVGGASAHDDVHGKPHFKGIRANPTAVMRALAADSHAAQNLAAVVGAPCISGFADIYPCQGIDLLAFMPLANIGGGVLASANDIWGWTDSATGREFALVGRSDGTAFVEITVPTNPVYLGRLPTHTITSSWRDIKVYKDHAFIVSEATGHGMQVFDLRQLLDVASPPETFVDTAQYNEFGNAHNIVINEDSGYAYAVGTSTCSGGLHMVDIADPLLPSAAGCFDADGYTHDAQCVIYKGPDVDYTGREICIASNEDTLTIVDVTNKALPVELSRTGYVGRGYTHQAWFSEDHKLIFLDDELDEQIFKHGTRTRVWNVADLDNPTVIDAFTNVTAAIDHNLYVNGDLIYQANYRAGLSVLEIARNADSTYNSLNEIAFFDIYPSSDSANFNGAWSNYPYFPSGTIVVSGIEQGLFVLALNLADDDAPTASFISPAIGDTVSGNVTLVAVAEDDGNVVEVTFFDGDSVIGSDTDPAGGWSVKWNTKKASAGGHTLSVEARDNGGQVSDKTSSEIFVTVGGSGGGGGGGPKCNPRRGDICP